MDSKTSGIDEAGGAHGDGPSGSPPDATSAATLPAGDGAALEAVAGLVAASMTKRRSDAVAPVVDERELAARLSAFDFDAPRPLDVAAADLLDVLGRFAVRSDHPAYFGLFNPPALAAGIAGDLVAAAVNPQLAVWSHAPAAVEIERRLISFFGSLVWPDADVAGTFTSGGSEANATALLAALGRRYRAWAEHGLAACDRRTAIFTSAESHLAWIKIARMSGLGSRAVVLVSTADGLSMSASDLEAAIEARPELDPVLIVGTAGTTAHGAIDDLWGLAGVAQAHGTHFHVDAAWAGGGLLHEPLRPLFDGIGLADSVTIDAHKWLAVPMGAGMYLARDWAPLEEAFGVSTGYMPSASTERRDPYIHSAQWSRRFIGAKLFLAMSVLGLDGYRAMFERQLAVAHMLRTRLLSAGWTIVNDTALPLVCFTAGGGGAVDEAILARVVASGSTWISTVRLRGETALRACVTSFETTGRDVDALLSALDDARSAVER